MRPAEICKALLAALDASEGRRRSRKRDQTPDAIGLHIKRELLERAVQEDPPPDAFEAWLLNCPLNCSDSAPAGAIAAMARIIFEEWSLAHSMNDFKSWLEHGAPSDDSNAPAASPREPDTVTQTLSGADSSSRPGFPSSPSPPLRGRGKGEGDLP
jgi:hypothetical protein